MTRVCVLPVAGKEDPGQMLMMQAVDGQGHFEMRHGVHARFFAATRSCLMYRPDILYFDWIGRYCIGRTRLITFAKIISFWIDIQIATKFFRKPILWSLHNLQSHERGPDAHWEMLMHRFFARQVTLIRVFSQNSVERASVMLGISRNKLRVLPGGSFVESYPSEISPQHAREKLGLADDDFVLLWLGSIRPYKGLTELIDAFCRQARPNWRLIIAGKPFLESYAREITIQAQRDQRIRVDARFIPENEMQVFYNASDAVVLPFAEVENTGSLVVAMGFRQPVVAPDLGVVGERLCQQRELVYAPGQLEGALQKLAQLPQPRLAAIGQANFAEIAKYKWADLDGLLLEVQKQK